MGPLALKGKEKPTNHSTSQLQSITHQVIAWFSLYNVASVTFWRDYKHDELRCFLLTGLDEHGQKDQQKAEEAGITPQAYVDGMAVELKRTLANTRYLCRYNSSVRQTITMKCGSKVFERPLAQDDIYLGEYSGWYSVSDEEFFTESQLAEVFRDENGKVIGGVAGPRSEWASEECYFLHASANTRPLG